MAFANKPLFTVTEHPERFPRELWQEFRDTTKAKGEQWIDVLRRLVEEYVTQNRSPKP
jgi:hypothetical protein